MENFIMKEGMSFQKEDHEYEEEQMMKRSRQGRPYTVITDKIYQAAIFLPIILHIISLHFSIHTVTSLLLSPFSLKILKTSVFSQTHKE